MKEEECPILRALRARGKSSDIYQKDWEVTRHCAKGPAAEGSNVLGLPHLR